MLIARFEAIRGHYWIELRHDKGEGLVYCDRDGRKGTLGLAFSWDAAIREIHRRASHYRIVKRVA